MWNLLKRIEKGKRACRILHVRNLTQAGIFKEDPIYKDPLQVHNESIKQTNYLNSANLTKPVYQRSNVGMHTILINKWMDIQMVNMLYKELRDAEVNYTKRFVFLTSLYNDICNHGYNLQDLLKICECYQKEKNSKYINILRKILININELVYLLFSYKKPLLSYCNGKLKGSAGSLCFLTNNSCAYYHSSYRYNVLEYSLLPYGGISYVLANLRGSLGFFLALTGKTVESSDLIWMGLAKRWLSDSALTLMEGTSECQLEVSEQDARILLEEHFLKVPKEYTLQSQEEIIHHHFKHNSLHQIMHSLRESTKSEKEDIQKWAKETLDQICSMPPLATHVTFEILNILRNYKRELLQKAKVSGNTWKELIKNSYKVPKSKEEVSMKELKDTIDSELLMKALTLETNAMLNFMSCPDVINAIAAYLVKDSPHAFSPSFINNNIFEVKKDIVHYFIYYRNDYEFLASSRTDISYSSLPHLQKYHPSFNEKLNTGYDRYYFSKQKQQWSENYLQKEIEEMNSHLQ